MSSTETSAAAYPKLRFLIGGEWRDGGPGRPVLNPADESVLGEVPHASRADLEDAVAAAAEGFRVWRSMAPARRAEIVIEAARIFRSRGEAAAVAMTLEQGKPIAQSRAEIARACEIIEWDANEGRRTYGRVIPAAPGLQQIVVREPVGVVAGFSPWNFPVNSPARKIAGTLSAGCAIILKASEETPAGAVMLAEAFVAAGLPAGVLNLVFGDPSEVSDFLINHDTVRMVTFTGSIPVGKHLAQMAAARMKPALMELGGHSPVIVCNDADPASAGSASAVGKARNAGQVCVSPTRFYVQEAIYDDFVEAFAAKAAAMRVGNGLDPETQLGPVANIRRLEAMERLVANATAKGARLAAGGRRIGNRGYFFPLTVLADVPDTADAMHEEPFGPLALVSPVRTVEEAIEKANSLPFGLAGYAFTRSARNVDLVSRGLEVGNLAINHFTASIAETPFGGVKESGYGREGGIEGLECYTTAKSVSHLVA